MYALGAAINITEFFENLLDVPYPLAKQGLTNTIIVCNMMNIIVIEMA